MPATKTCTEMTSEWVRSNGVPTEQAWHEIGRATQRQMESTANLLNISFVARKYFRDLTPASG